MYLIAGTQADKAKNNELYVMKVSQLHKTLKEGEHHCIIVDDKL
jgi:hypothetical protein